MPRMSATRPFAPEWRPRRRPSGSSPENRRAISGWAPTSADARRCRARSAVWRRSKTSAARWKRLKIDEGYLVAALYGAGQCDLEMPELLGGDRKTRRRESRKGIALRRKYLLLRLRLAEAYLAAKRPERRTQAAQDDFSMPPDPEFVPNTRRWRAGNSSARAYDGGGRKSHERSGCSCATFGQLAERACRPTWRLF